MGPNTEEQCHQLPVIEKKRNAVSGISWRDISLWEDCNTFASQCGCMFVCVFPRQINIILIFVLWFVWQYILQDFPHFHFNLVIVTMWPKSWRNYHVHLWSWVFLKWMYVCVCVCILLILLMEAGQNEAHTLAQRW